MLAPTPARRSLARCSAALALALASAGVPACAERTAVRDGAVFPDAPLVIPDGGGPDTPRADAPFVPVDTGPSTGLVCEACATDEDCGTRGYCVELRVGQSVCLRTCDPDLAECPTNFDCFNSLIRPRPLPVCTPVGSRCCVDGDGDDYGVGVGCNGADCDDTVESTHADAVEECNGIDDDCDGTVDDGASGVGIVCSTGMAGVCSSGVTACTAGVLTCVPAAATMTETCNGIDDDCDSRLDEDASGTGAVLTRSCYGGPSGTGGVGICMPGVQSCVGGDYSACIGEVVPAAGEVCNAIDDDCDGTVDDGNPGGGLSCSTGFIGACGAGQVTCVGGLLTCRSLSMGSTEICDGEDNDCDGLLNEGFPGLGTACTSGLGTCRVGGVTTCNPTNPSAAPVCNAMPAAGRTEQCDYVDDDCDGLVDDGFVGATGRYDTVRNCGACGFDCSVGWPGGPASVNVSPICDASTATPSCGYTCLPGWGDADGVRENGCEFPIEPNTIYVSTPANGGLDGATCGAVDSPCATIGRGLTRATATGGTRVRVSTGLFVENVTLVNGVELLGGHSAISWARDPSVFPTTLRGADAAPPASVGSAADRVTVIADAITSRTELSGFTINTVNGGAAGNSIAVWVRNSDNDLIIRDNAIIAADGGGGATGTVGAAGAAGGNGAAGTGAARRACSGSTTAGPAGAVLMCGGTAASGGAGGSALNPTTSPVGMGTRSGSGAAGLRAGVGGAGGIGGYNMLGLDPMGPGARCNIVNSPTDGSPGAAGAEGTDGAGGAGAVAGGGVVGAEWRGTSGSVGTTGLSGGGGGGGGSPGGVMEYACAADYTGCVATGQCVFSATGGSGGAGGCGGAGGGGGTAGGGSFGIFLVFTSTPTAATMPVLTGNTFRRGRGGRGGDGGTGGGGGDSGLGGAGGPAGGDSTFGFCLSPGSIGGPGGRGGHAGGGGGGGGGASYDIYVSRPGTANPTYDTTNTFEIPAATDTGGAGGAGGNSSNTSVGIGRVGARGQFGTVRIGT